MSNIVEYPYLLPFNFLWFVLIFLIILSWVSNKLIFGISFRNCSNYCGTLSYKVCVNKYCCWISEQNTYFFILITALYPTFVTTNKRHGNSSCNSVISLKHNYNLNLSPIWFRGILPLISSWDEIFLICEINIISCICALKNGFWLSNRKWKLLS